MPNKYLDSVGLAEYTSLVKADLATKAPLASPALTGTPTAPTPTAGDDSTKIATTEFVQEEIRQHGNVPVGFEYFSMNPNVPQGSLPLLGGEYDRSTYQDLWAWVQEQTGYLKTEAEWQALSTANNGNVPYYSSGDGSTTFRVPSLRCWVKGTDGSAQLVGSYLEAGLPNITGSIMARWDSAGYYAGFVGANGAFYTSGEAGQNAARGSGNTGGLNQLKIDASRSSAIYGKSSTVQPESIVGMWLVKAYGVVEDTGSIDEQAYIDDRFNAAKQYTDTEVSGAVSAINTRLGTILSARGSSTTAGSDVTLCSITNHPAGVWLITSNVILSTSASVVYANTITVSGTGSISVRGNGTSGGGSSNVYIAEIAENKTVFLRSFIPSGTSTTINGVLYMVQLA